MSDNGGPWIEIWEECDFCKGTGSNPEAHQMDSPCPKCMKPDEGKKGKVGKMITFPEFHDIMHRH